MNIERRRHPRIETLDMVSYENLETTKTELMQGMGETFDLSEGGVCFISQNALPLGSTIRLTMALEDKIFACEGKIVSLNLTKDLKVKIHVEFTAVDDDDLQTLREYLSKVHGDDQE